jgi:hypothetical protein
LGLVVAGDPNINLGIVVAHKENRYSRPALRVAKVTSNVIITDVTNICEKMNEYVRDQNIITTEPSTNISFLIIGIILGTFLGISLTLFLNLNFNNFGFYLEIYRKL